MNAEELSDRLLDCAVRLAKVAEALPGTRVGRHVAGQLVRCGTSPGPNYEEGCAAESRADFAHKLNIALTEMRESRYWLRFIVRYELLPQTRLSELVDECTQLVNIIGSSVATVKGKRRVPNDSELGA